ncbi:glucuronosyltransferase [Caenorhabditis elegans]|uniref:glucuronosyltransferase n=1 Tax=Caenorhabditis elegans TaxID=6239 RepID=G5EES5_CAEEL|nr:glucuronosyltransferase [Caenorhabditis elegans]CAA98274.2 glucuronosyltransferase [Caenorhabditis elegans]|eukprot:NP_505728.2 UDP-GlucuronosylTransferase [Caenorhabditis elegans]
MIRSYWHFSLFLLHLLPQLTLSYNYLVFCPLFAHSHHKFLAKIADTLTEAGHNVTFLMPIIHREYENVKYLEHTTDIVYIQPDKELEEIAQNADYSTFWKNDFGILTFIPAIERFFRMFTKVHDILKKDLSVLDNLKNRKFDAMIFESLAFCAHPIREYLEIKTIFPSWSMTHMTELSQAIGEPSSPTFLPITISPFGDKMTFKERLLNTLADFTFTHIFQPPTLTSFKYPHQTFDFKEILSQAPFIFFNSNPFLDFPRPTLTKTIEIGGISVNATLMRLEKLPEEYNTILNLKQQNVLISFGSMLRSSEMPVEYKDTIAQVVRSFPSVTFIWKYENNNVEFAENLPNFHFFKWVPQTALLADSRLSAFITHAGLGSINELSYIGKPAILVPIFADQLRNAKMLVRHNGSIELDKKDLGKFDVLRDAVDAILNDKSYTNNAILLSQQLESQPFSPHDLLVKYAEFGAKFGELPSLDPHYRKMSFFSFFMIDIILFLTATFAIFVSISLYLFRVFFKSVFVRKEKIN